MKYSEKTSKLFTLSVVVAVVERRAGEAALLPACLFSGWSHSRLVLAGL